MIYAMRIVNLVFLVLVVISGMGSIYSSFQSNLIQGLGAILGIGLFGVPFYLCYQGLGVSATASQINRGKIANLLLLTLVVAYLGVMAYSSDFSILPAFVIFLIVPSLTFVALRKRQSSSEEVVSKDQAVPVFMHISPSSSNYFVRHWRGELSLARSYWVNGSLLAGAGVNLLGTYLGTIEHASLRMVALQAIAFLFIAIGAWVWSVVGIWRSADAHPSRGGALSWAVVAKFFVVIGALVMAGKLTTSFGPQIKEFSQIALGKDPLGKVTVTVGANGQSILVSGMLGEGSADEVQKIVSAAPAAHILVLDSRGGRLLEAKQIADLVRKKRFDTYTEGQCASACTFIFLAGKDRAATPNAQIGFHQPSIAGFEPRVQRDITQEMGELYRTAGLPAAFIRKAQDTPAGDMWYPTRDELIQANVLTRITLGGETTTLSARLASREDFLLALKSIPLFFAFEERFPGMLQKMADDSWRVKVKGGSDGEIQSAARSVLGNSIPQILKVADDRIQLQFAQFFVTQLSAARAISGQACGMLLDGKLDVTATLPKTINDQEHVLLMDMLKSPSRSQRALPSMAEREAGIGVAAQGLPDEYLLAVVNPSEYQNRPDLRCDATLALYRNVIGLPDRLRRAALVGMFAGG